MISAPPSPTSSTTSSNTTSSSCQLHTASDAPPALCRYAGKRCYNARATKRNGSLHNLCHVHRVRANQNQRRMELKRRITRARVDGAADAAHTALYHTLPISSSNVSGLDMGDIDAHLGWVSAPAPAHIAPHTSQLAHDYSLTAFEGLFMDLNGDVFAKDAAHVNVFVHEPQQVAPGFSNNFINQHYQQQAEAFHLHHHSQQQQSDMWVVPNFLLTL